MDEMNKALIIFKNSKNLKRKREQHALYPVSPIYIYKLPGTPSDSEFLGSTAAAAASAGPCWRGCAMPPLDYWPTGLSGWPAPDYFALTGWPR